MQELLLIPARLWHDEPPHWVDAQAAVRLVETPEGVPIFASRLGGLFVVGPDGVRARRVLLRSDEAKRQVDAARKRYSFPLPPVLPREAPQLPEPLCPDCAEWRAELDESGAFRWRVRSPRCARLLLDAEKFGISRTCRGYLRFFSRECPPRLDRSGASAAEEMLLYDSRLTPEGIAELASLAPAFLPQLEY